MEESTHLPVMPLMTTKEAASYIGISYQTLRTMMHNREIPYYKPNGKLCFFKREDIDAWLTSNRISSMTEMNIEASKYCMKSKF